MQVLHVVTILHYFIYMRDKSFSSPLPTLITDMVHSHSGSSSLINKLNQLGLYVSMDTLVKHMVSMCQKPSDQLAILDRLSRGNLVVTMGILDWMLHSALQYLNQTDSFSSGSPRVRFSDCKSFDIQDWTHTH